MKKTVIDSKKLNELTFKATKLEELVSKINEIDLEAPGSLKAVGMATLNIIFKK